MTAGLFWLLLTLKRFLKGLVMSWTKLVRRGAASRLSLDRSGAGTASAEDRRHKDIIFINAIVPIPAHA